MLLMATIFVNTRCMSDVTVAMDSLIQKSCEERIYKQVEPQSLCYVRCCITKLNIDFNLNL